MNHLYTPESAWKYVWLGVNATLAAAWSLVAASIVLLSWRGDVAPSATGATVALLIGIAWLVAAVRSVRAEQRFPSGLFWFAISGTLGAAGAIGSAAAMDFTQSSEAADPGGLGPLGIALVCALVWFGISLWGAAHLVARIRKGA